MPTDTLGHQALKTKQRLLRDGFPAHLGLRVHRAISWVGRAEREADDQDAAFIFYWIGLNASYANDIRMAPTGSERSNFSDFFNRLIQLDHDQRIYNAIWTRFPSSIRLFLENRYVFQPFWNHQNGLEGHEDWEERFARSRKRSLTALQNRETGVILSTLFDRLYVLRNQLVHGGATWDSKVNRGQVHDGVKILSFLLPICIDLQMDNPDTDWGRPFYPVVSD